MPPEKENCPAQGEAVKSFGGDNVMKYTANTCLRANLAQYAAASR